MKLKSYLTLVILAVGLAVSASASTYTFAASSIPGNSNTLTLTSGGQSITLDGFDAATTNPVKTSTIGGTWNGSSGDSTDDIVGETVNGALDIGLANGGITADSFVQFNLSSLITATHVTQLSITLVDSESGQTGESAVTWDVWDSQTATSNFNLLATGTTLTSQTATFTINAADPYIEVSGGDCVVLINQIVASTPEPSTFALGLIACLALASPKLRQRFARKRTA